MRVRNVEMDVIPGRACQRDLRVFVLVVFQAIVLGGQAGRQHSGWKTKILPLLFTGLESAPMDPEGSLAETGAINQRAKDMRVVLRMTEVGWRFVEVPSGMHGTVELQTLPSASQEQLNGKWEAGDMK